MKFTRAWIRTGGQIVPVLITRAARVIPMPKAATVLAMTNRGSHSPPMALRRWGSPNRTAERITAILIPAGSRVCRMSPRKNASSVHATMSEKTANSATSRQPVTEIPSVRENRAMTTGRRYSAMSRRRPSVVNPAFFHHPSPDMSRKAPVPMIR